MKADPDILPVPEDIERPTRQSLWPGVSVYSMEKVLERLEERKRSKKEPESALALR